MCSSNLGNVVLVAGVGRGNEYYKKKVDVMRIGYLEDDPSQSGLVMSWLEAEGIDVVHADNGEGFLKLLRDNPVDLFILDWQLPDMEGPEVLVKLRENLGLKTPVIFATQRDSEQDIVSALRAGADDYVRKPLSKGELLARVNAIARRAGIVGDETLIEVGSILINTGDETVRVDGELVKMTPKDYRVALCLLKNIGKMLSREYLLREVWGIDAPLNTRTVDVHVSRVRRSLNLVPENGYCVKTIYQHGYRLERVKAAVTS